MAYKSFRSGGYISVPASSRPPLSEIASSTPIAVFAPRMRETIAVLSESLKCKDGATLRTYDPVVANPPFSDHAWRPCHTFPHAVGISIRICTTRK